VPFNRQADADDFPDCVVYVPHGHGTHASDPDTRWLYVLIGHVAQADAPANAEYVPGPHDRHAATDVWLVNGLYVPTLHRYCWSSPGQYAPARHVQQPTHWLQK